MACLKALEGDRLLEKLELEISSMKRKEKDKTNQKMSANLEEKSKKLEITVMERDKFERDLLITKTELANVKRTLDLERQERRELESKALNLIKTAKKNWENAEKDKINQLNQHIDSQTVRITELCTSNNEMSSKLQRMESELETANAELSKLRALQIEYKGSLSKMRELNRQSAQGVEDKLEQISARAHNHIADLRTKLELETAKSLNLEQKLQKEEDVNHCRQSRLNVALELTQNELKDCQEQLRSLKATIPARDAEIETLKNQLQDKIKQLESATSMEQLIITLQEQLERLTMENAQLRNQLDATKADFNDTMLHIEQNEACALERLTNEKNTLESQLKNTLEKEDKHLQKINELEELVRSLKQKIVKLEGCASKSKYSGREVTFHNHSKENIEALDVEPRIQDLQQQLKTCKEQSAEDRQTAKQAQLNLWKKEKELSEANLDKRIALRDAKKAEEKIKVIQQEKERLFERLNTKLKDESEKLKEINKELQVTKKSLAEATKDSSRYKLLADSSQRALTQSNKQNEDLQISNATLRRELESTRKQLLIYQERADSVKSEKERLSLKISKLTDDKNTLEQKCAKLQEDIDGYQINIQLLKETATVLEEQLNDYEKLTSDHETRENMLIQEKMKLQKDLESAETKLRETILQVSEEKAQRIVLERTIETIKLEYNDLEVDLNAISSQKDQYKKISQKLNKQVEELENKCRDLECNLSELKRLLEAAQNESVMVKEESTRHLTKMHELSEAKEKLIIELQETAEYNQELQVRISELEDVLVEMRQFYQNREVRVGSTCQQQTKLIDFLQLKLEENEKKKKKMCSKILGLKQKENIQPLNPTALPIGYRELENQLEAEKAKVKTLTEQLLALKASRATSPIVLHQSPNKVQEISGTKKSPSKLTKKQLSMQRIKHNITHRFNVCMTMRAGKCAGCCESIQLGKRVCICSECQIMAHCKCSGQVPLNCCLPKSLEDHLENASTSLSSSIQTLSIDEPDISKNKEINTKTDNNQDVQIEGWINLSSKLKSYWEKKYVRLEGHFLRVYDEEPKAGVFSTDYLDLSGKNEYTLIETVNEAEVPNTASSDLPFIFRLELTSPSTCWPSSRIDLMALSQSDKKNWLKALSSLSNQLPQIEKYQTIIRLEKNKLDLNTAVELDNNTLLLGAEEGLFSYKLNGGQFLTLIRGVKKVHQLTIHSQLGLGMMIAGEDRRLVSCDLWQLKNNALAADCSRPAISIKSVLLESQSCHLYQIQEEMLCAATTSHIILLKWMVNDGSGEFVSVRELETQEPCSCALFLDSRLIVGCHKFFQIDMYNYTIDEFPENDCSVKAVMNGVARLGIFPVYLLNVSGESGKLELLLCYNEFGVFVNENGHRTRNFDPTWSHLPFAFAFCHPFLYIVHFSSIEILKLDSNSYSNSSKNTERYVIELSNLRYLGQAHVKGIYVSTTDTTLEILKVEAKSNSHISSTSLNNLSQIDDSSSEFSFTSSILEVLDGQGKKVHFSNPANP